MVIKEELQRLIWEDFLHVPTSEQRDAVGILVDFLTLPHANAVLLLRGYAGTGKTSLVGALVKVLGKLKRGVVLMAPTGRAAKVFSSYSGHVAYTIHRKIYRQKKFTGDFGEFGLNVNLHRNTVFIVDESSMISNEGLTGTTFGTGRLLDDLIHYVYSGEGCRLMLVGDAAQLPPVGEEESPALSKEALQGYGLEVMSASLTQVVRQDRLSGILWNATAIRRLITDGDFFDYPRVRFSGFPDVCRVTGEELIERLEECYYKCGVDETIVVTRSNKRANVYNTGIRARILGYEEELSSGDRLIIAKNNYYWGAADREKDNNAMDFIANGDVAKVMKFRRERSLYGFRFADVLLRFTDYDDREEEVTLLLDTLQAEAPALPRERALELFNAVWEDYPELINKRDRIKKVKEDLHYNALQVKYAYAVTCHKAQGGQWENVFLDLGYFTEDMLSPDYFRWLYTAFTRATQRLYLVNWPKEQTEDSVSI